MTRLCGTGKESNSRLRVDINFLLVLAILRSISHAIKCSVCLQKDMCCFAFDVKILMKVFKRVLE